MESTIRLGRWKLGTIGVLSALNKLMAVGIAWLIFFHLLLLGWDVQAQQEHPGPKSPFAYYEPATSSTLKGGIEK